MAVAAEEVEGAEATKQVHWKPALTPKCNHAVAMIAVVDVDKNLVLGDGTAVVLDGGVAPDDAAVVYSIGVVVDN